MKKLPLPERGRRIYYDAAVHGFGVRVSSNGSKVFVLNYSVAGRERRLTIGAWPTWSVQAAREEAKRLRRRVDVGEDPLRERDEERGAATVSDLLDAFEADELPLKSASTRRNYVRVFRDLARPRLGRLKAAEVRRADVEALHRSLRATPYAANHAVAVLRAVFNWGIVHELVDGNPARGIKKFPEPPRCRYLSPDELGRLRAALDGDDNQEAADAIRLLVLTGARKSEVTRMRWGDVDLEAGTWVKPHSSTKQRREHRVPLSAAAVEVLRKRKPAAVGPFVFPGRSPDAPRNDLRWAWPRILERAGLEGVRIHDLRHSFASLVASSGGSLLVIGELLGHSQASTTKRYSHLFDEVTRGATQAVGAAFEAASADPETEVPEDQLA